MNTDTCEVVITAPDPDWLAAFVRQLVADRLAACGHHVTPIRSIYRWQGGIHDKTEARASLHTRTTLVPEICQRTTRAHPYETPCVVAVPIVDGHPAYLQWIIDETREPSFGSR